MTQTQTCKQAENLVKCEKERINNTIKENGERPTVIPFDVQKRQNLLARRILITNAKRLLPMT